LGVFHHNTTFLLPDWSDDTPNPDGTLNTTSLRLGVYGAIGFGQGKFSITTKFLQGAER